MSHEIRTPLNAILMAVPILADEIDKYNDDAQIIIRSVDSAGKRLLRTLDMILNMSAVQTGNYKPDFEKINIEVELAFPGAANLCSLLLNNKQIFLVLTKIMLATIANKFSLNYFYYYSPPL